MFGTFIVNDSSGWGCGYFNEVYYTTNYGLQWMLMNCGIPDNTNLDDLWFINDSIGFVSGSTGIYRLVQRPNKTLTITGDSLKCKYDFVTLTTDDGFSNYLWFEITGNNDTIPMNNHSNSIQVDTGKYFVMLKNSCDTATSKPFIVRNYPPLDSDIVSPQSYYCVGDTAIIIVKTPKGYEFVEWIVYDVTDDENLIIKEFQNADTFIIAGVSLAMKNARFIYRNPIGCLDTLEFLFDIKDTKKPILIADGNLNFCIGSERKIILLNANIFSENTWYLYDSVVASNVSEIKISQSGIYSVIASINGFCTDSSDKLTATIREEGDILDISISDAMFFVDSVNYWLQGSRSLTITNNSNYQFILDQITFSKKFAFSVSMSQFPIIFAPGETKYILIYYTPTDLDYQYDTMYIEDNCTIRVFPLSGFGKANSDEVKTICGVDVAIATRSVDVIKIMTLDNPVPTPIHSQGKVSYSITTEWQNGIVDSDTFTENNLPNATLFNTLAVVIPIEFYINNTNTINSENKNIVAGEIIFDMQNLVSGVYFLRISYENSNHIFSIIKN